MSRFSSLAKTIVEHSCSVQPGENVYIMGEGLEGKPLIEELVRQVYAKGANPFVDLVDTKIQRLFLMGANPGLLELYGDMRLEMLKKMQCLIVVSALENPYVYADVPQEKMSAYNRNVLGKCIYGYAVEHVKWIYLKYPTNSMAILCQKNQEEFEAYFNDVCCMDYTAMSAAMDILKDRLSRTDRVRVVAKDTDIQFSVRGIGVQKSDGKNGLPDGEVYTAPVRDSVNGYIHFNVPLRFRGILFDDIRLEVENGKVVRATANDTEAFNRLLDQDEGGRYFGEFAIAVNNRIRTPMQDILFDEKMGGSIHFALGNAYVTTENGNHSVIHMDIVQMHTKEYGGGEIYFDGELIRKDGKFVPEDLRILDTLC